MKQLVNPYDYISYSKNYLNNKQDENYIPEKGSLSFSFGTTEHKCFLLEIEPRNGIQERLEIQFVPDTIGGVRTAKLKDISVIGRNNPFLHYTGGRELINLPLEFYSDIEAHDDVKKKIDWLRSLTINNGKIGGYNRIKIVFGGLFRWEEFAVKSVKYNYTHFDGNSDFLPLRATATVSLQVDGVQDSNDDVNINNFRY